MRELEFSYRINKHKGNRMTTRKIIRNDFAAIGYRVSFKRNPCTDTLCAIAFQSPNMLKPCEISSSNVYDAEFYRQHEAAFALADIYRGQCLEDTEQKIT